jgi:hypothetical protein
MIEDALRHRGGNQNMSASAALSSLWDPENLTSIIDSLSNTTIKTLRIPVKKIADSPAPFEKLAARDSN